MIIKHNADNMGAWALDVGGGSTLNSAPHALSDIPLRWMVRQVAQAQCGIQFDNDAIKRAGIPLNTILGTGFTTVGVIAPAQTNLTKSPVESSSLSAEPKKIGDGKIQPTLHFFAEPKEKKETLLRAATVAAREGQPEEKIEAAVIEVSKPMVPKSPDIPCVGVGRVRIEEGGGASGSGGAGVGEEDGHVRKSEDSTATNSSSGSSVDAMQPIDDELAKNKWWWLLEIIPTSYSYQDGRGEWHTKWECVSFSSFVVALLGSGF